MVNARVLVTIAAAALALPACAEPASHRHAEPHQTASAPAPLRLAPPVGTPILTIDPKNGADPVRADFAGLDAVATRTYDVYEPFDRKRMAFRGVELAAVLDAAGVPASATNVRLTALDDYVVDFKVADIRKGGVILATRAGGDTIPVAKGGPIRIVFTDGTPLGENDDRWIWSVARIEVS
jgi:hypothetical protein